MKPGSRGKQNIRHSSPTDPIILNSISSSLFVCSTVNRLISPTQSPCKWSTIYSVQTRIDGWLEWDRIRCPSTRSDNFPLSATMYSPPLVSPPNIQYTCNWIQRELQTLTRHAHHKYTYVSTYVICMHHAEHTDPTLEQTDMNPWLSIPYNVCYERNGQNRIRSCICLFYDKLNQHGLLKPSCVLKRWGKQSTLYTWNKCCCWALFHHRRDRYGKRKDIIIIREK